MQCILLHCLLKENFIPFNIKHSYVPFVLYFQVKEERPSPVSECGLCMHPPRTPHTSECVFPYGLAPPSPVALMPGPPRPLGATPPQRPVPHIPPQPPLSVSLYQRSIKQEKLDG